MWCRYRSRREVQGSKSYFQHKGKKGVVLRSLFWHPSSAPRRVMVPCEIDRCHAVLMTVS